MPAFTLKASIRGKEENKLDSRTGGFRHVKLVAADRFSILSAPLLKQLLTSKRLQPVAWVEPPSVEACISTWKACFEAI